jgi:hypothetical protein
MSHVTPEHSGYRDTIRGEKPHPSDGSMTAKQVEWEMGEPQHAWTPESLARFFHDTYEMLAPSFGYETRKDTRDFNPKSQNGRLMVAVCEAVLLRFRAAFTAEQQRLDQVLISEQKRHREVERLARLDGWERGLKENEKARVKPLQRELELQTDYSRRLKDALGPEKFQEVCRQLNRDTKAKKVK